MSNQFTSKQKIIFTSILFILGGIITLLIFIENNYRYQKIYKEKFLCTAKVINEQRDYIGGKPQTYKYTLQYFYKNKLYIGDAPHMYEFGHFKKGQNVEIILQKTNPNNFIVAENSNYLGSLFVSISFFTLSFFGLKYRELLSNYIF